MENKQTNKQKITKERKAIKTQWSPSLPHKCLSSSFLQFEESLLVTSISGIQNFAGQNQMTELAPGSIHHSSAQSKQVRKGHEGRSVTPALAAAYMQQKVPRSPLGDAKGSPFSKWYTLYQLPKILLFLCSGCSPEVQWWQCTEMPAAKTI